MILCLWIFLMIWGKTDRGRWWSGRTIRIFCSDWMMCWVGRMWFVLWWEGLYCWKWLWCWWWCKCLRLRCCTTSRDTATSRRWKILSSSVRILMCVICFCECLFIMLLCLVKEMLGKKFLIFCLKLVWIWWWRMRRRIRFCITRAGTVSRSRLRCFWKRVVIRWWWMEWVRSWLNLLSLSWRILLIMMWSWSARSRFNCVLRRFGVLLLNGFFNKIISIWNCCILNVIIY